MQTKCHPRAIHQPTTRHPERRMERRNRRSESGNRREEAGLRRKPYNREPKLGVHDFLAGMILLCRAIRGRVGNRVYKTYGEKIIVTRIPRFDGYVPTAAQRDHRDKMRAATAYARAVYADPVDKAVYIAAAKQLGRQPFRLAVSDFLHGRPRVTLVPAAPETTKVPQAPRIPVHRPAADLPSARGPRTPASPRSKSRLAILAHFAEGPRAQRARDRFRKRFRAVACGRSNLPAGQPQTERSTRNLTRWSRFLSAMSAPTSPWLRCCPTPCEGSCRKAIQAY
jgi:hypothetical protein